MSSSLFPLYYNILYRRRLAKSASSQRGGGVTQRDVMISLPDYRVLAYTFIKLHILLLYIKLCIHYAPRAACFANRISPCICICLPRFSSIVVARRSRTARHPTRVAADIVTLVGPGDTYTSSLLF